MSLIEDLKRTEAGLRGLKAPRGHGNGRHFGQSAASRLLARARERRSKPKAAATDTTTAKGD